MEKTIIYNKASGDHLQHNLEMFKELGYKVIEFRFLNKTLVKNNPAIVYLNWYEGIVTDKTNKLLPVYFRAFLKFITLQYLRVSRHKVVMSFHNKENHSKVSRWLGNYMLKLVLEVSDKIIVFNKCGFKDLERYLAKEQILKKAVHIPAVNYIGRYPDARHEWIADLQSKPQMKILFAGRMNQPYKNVPMIMEIARKLQGYDILFVFAGNAREYKSEYLSLKEGLDNVVAEFRFVEDNEMAHLLEMCDAMIVPYDVESISNSGTARLAFSYARTVICPDIPFLEDIPHDLIYTYNYIDHSDHKKQCEEAILAAYSDWQKDKNSLHKKGDDLRHIMEEFNSEDVIKEKYKELFDSLLPADLND